MASKRYEEKYGEMNDVEVHHQYSGCEIDGRIDKHTHTQPDWREHVDEVGKRMGL